jgi:hypothetical protein
MYKIKDPIDPILLIQKDHKSDSSGQCRNSQQIYKPQFLPIQPQKGGLAPKRVNLSVNKGLFYKIDLIRLSPSLDLGPRRDPSLNIIGRHLGLWGDRRPIRREIERIQRLLKMGHRRQINVRNLRLLLL